MRSVHSDILVMTEDETAFFKALGTRLTGLRKAQGLTQTQLGELLGVSQQTINSFEKGRRRVPVSALPTLSEVFGVSVDVLVNAQPTSSAKRGPTPQLQQKIEQLRTLPRPKQKFVMEMIDTVLQQAGR